MFATSGSPKPISSGSKALPTKYWWEELYPYQATGSSEWTIKPPMITESFSFTRNGHTLRGLIDLPDDRCPIAGLALVPGHGQTHVASGEHNKALRTRLTNAGVACCEWDRVGCGNSDGTYDHHQPVEDSGEEAAVAIDAFAAQVGLEIDRIGFWGGSRAGWICAWALQRRPAMGFWIIFSPGGDHDNFPFLLETNLRLEGRSEPQIQRLLEELRQGQRLVRTGGTFSEYLDATAQLRADAFYQYLNIFGTQGEDEEGFYREQEKHKNGVYTVDETREVHITPWLYQTLACIRCPVLAMFGEKDTFVDARETARLYREALKEGGNPDFTIHMFADGNHALGQCETGGVRETMEQFQNGTFSSCDPDNTIMMEWMRQRGFAH